MQPEKRSTHLETTDALILLNQRLAAKKEEILGCTHKIVELVEGRGGSRDLPSIETLTAIKKEINTILECVSEIRPYSADRFSMVTLEMTAGRFALLTELSDAAFGMYWPLLRVELQQFCHSANGISFTPIRESQEMAFGAGIKSRWGWLTGLFQRRRSNF